MPAVGVDHSMQMTRIASRRLRRAGIRPRIVRGSASALPFAPARFRSIVVSFPSEFAFASSTAEELWRVLDAESALTMVLSARITGKMVMDRLAAILFRITHQSAEIQDGWLEPYRQLGFELDRQDRSTGRARIARIIAWKPRG